MSNVTRISRIVAIIIVIAIVTAGVTPGHAKTKLVKGKLLGNVYATGYCAHCNTPRGSRATKSGHKARPHHTIAVDMHNPIAKMGKTVFIKGHKYRVEDVGNLNANGNGIDIFFANHSVEGHWGRRRVKVYASKRKKIKPKKKLLSTVMSAYNDFEKSKSSKTWYDISFDEKLTGFQIKTPSDTANKGDVVQISNTLYTVVGNCKDETIIFAKGGIEPINYAGIDMIWKNAKG